MHPTQCARCGTDATMRCIVCKDAPEYQPGDAVGSVYCNRDCQKADWPNHKPHCRVLGQRKKLLRAAIVLKAALLTYREVVYDVDLTKIEVRDGVLYLDRNRKPITDRLEWGLFPEHLTTDIEHKEAALAYNQSGTATALLSGLTRKLLKGTASKIEAVDLHIPHPPLPTILLPGPDFTEESHSVLKVSLAVSRSPSAPETWTLDTTGCQYGFRDVLVPWDKYLSDHSCKITREPLPYVTTETADLDCYADIPVLNMTAAQREDGEMERRARVRFAGFVRGEAVIGKEILDGSAVEFEGKVDRFLGELRVHMMGLGHLDDEWVDVE